MTKYIIEKHEMPSSVRAFDRVKTKMALWRSELTTSMFSSLISKGNWHELTLCVLNIYIYVFIFVHRVYNSNVENYMNFFDVMHLHWYSYFI